MNLCKQQFHCTPYTNGSSSRDHFARDNEACKNWLAMDCEKMEAVIELHQYTTGRPVVCNIEKIRRIKKEFK